METTRRNFLKIVVAVGAASVAPLRLLAADEPLATRDKLVGLVRETFHASMHSGHVVVRHDIRTSTMQLGVDALLRSDEHTWYNAQDLEHARHAALDVLMDEMGELGIGIQDLVPLPPIQLQPNQIGTFTPTWTGFSQ